MKLPKTTFSRDEWYKNIIQILGYGGAASMVHPASGYLIGNVLRRAPLVAKAVSEAIKNKNLSTLHIARKGWETLWSKELIRKKSLYQFGLEKLMRFDEKLLREFFGSFFQLPKNQWYGFLTDTLSLREIVYAMCVMFYIQNSEAKMPRH